MNNQPFSESTLLAKGLSLKPRKKHNGSRPFDVKDGSGPIPFDITDSGPRPFEYNDEKH